MIWANSWSGKGKSAHHSSHAAEPALGEREEGPPTVDASVAVHVGQLDHLVELGVGQVFAERLEHVAQLVRGDGAAAVLVEHLEGVHELLLAVGLLDGLRHEVEEF